MAGRRRPPGFIPATEDEGRRWFADLRNLAGDVWDFAGFQENGPGQTIVVLALLVGRWFNQMAVSDEDEEHAARVIEAAMNYAVNGDEGPLQTLLQARAERRG